MYAAISIGGLAVGLAAALVTLLYIQDELTFDRFIPGHDKVYVATTELRLPDRAPLVADGTPSQMAGWLKAAFPDIPLIVRWSPSPPTTMRHGEIEAGEEVAWVDPGFFKMLPLPATGDPEAAIGRPDTVVLTRTLAQKYFGRPTPIGDSLEIDGHPMRVAAVLDDLPPNTHLTSQVFASARAPFSRLAQSDATPYRKGNLSTSGRTYLRFSSTAQAARVAARITDEMRARLGAGTAAATYATFELVPLDDFHLHPFTTAEMQPGAPPGDPKVLTSLAAISLLIVLLAAVNFVNLMTARAGRRSIEVGVRKAVGAGRGHLVLQFLGEALLHTVAAMVLALALVELCLPLVNAALLKGLRLDYLRDIPLLAATIGLPLGLGVLAGAYPAFVLSGFRPGPALKGDAGSGGAGLAYVRQGLVILQFAVVVGLILAVIVIQRQTRFALTEGAHLDADQVVTIGLNTPGKRTKPPCWGAPFVEQMRKLPGVIGVSCATDEAIGLGENIGGFKMADGSLRMAQVGGVDYDTFRLFGVRLLAGRSFAPQHGEDVVPATAPGALQVVHTVVLNATAARSIGFADPARAVGATVKLIVSPKLETVPVQIVGVTPDFSVDLLHGRIKAMIYMLDPNDLDMASVKLRGGSIPETLQAIDRLWKTAGGPGPIRRRFLSERMQTLYLGAIRQGWWLSVLTGLAVVIGASGLFAFSAFTAERRIKEIGVRKAMGASSLDVVRLLLWSFTKPVLWANLIAWPVAGWTMSRWLEGFASHISLSPLYFLAAGGAALGVASLTVAAQAVKTARAKPVTALRYE
ncbi:MAG TPA: ABC transporter permease [Caulobacteraceae bacterium]